MKRWYRVVVYLKDGTSRKFQHEFRNEITAIREVLKWLATERNAQHTTWEVYRVDCHACAVLPAEVA